MLASRSTAIVRYSKNLEMLNRMAMTKLYPMMDTDVLCFRRFSGKTTAIKRSMVTITIERTDPTLPICAKPKLKSKTLA